MRQEPVGDRRRGPAQVLEDGPALGVGALLSHYVHHQINERFMRSFVQLFAVASGVVLLVKAL